MKPLLRDPSRAEELEERGLCCLPLLNERELSALRELFERLHPGGVLPNIVGGVHMTILARDPAFKASVRDGLTAILAAACDRAFERHRLIAPFFIAKPSREDSFFGLHQDISAVDEAREWAVKLWIALEDCSEANGAFWYLPHSHRLPHRVRGLGTLWPQLLDVAEKARPWLRVCEVRAGTAVVFFHRLVHGSPANRSPLLRVAVSANILPMSVPLRLYVQRSEESPLEVYEAPDDYVYDDPSAFRQDVAAIPPRSRRVDVLPPHPRPVVRWDDLQPLLQNAASG
jgi:hypothetical protein